MGAARSSLFFEKVEKGRMGGAVETTGGTSRSGYRRWSDGFISGDHPTDFPGQHVLFLSRSISSLWDAVYLLSGVQYIFSVGCSISSLWDAVYLLCGMQYIFSVGCSISSLWDAGLHCSTFLPAHRTLLWVYEGGLLRKRSPLVPPKQEKLAGLGQHPVLRVSFISPADADRWCQSA